MKTKSEMELAVGAAQKAAWAVESSVTQLENAKRHERYALIVAMDKELDRKYDPDIRAEEKRAAAAQVVVDEARMALTLAYPDVELGAIYERWDSGRYTWHNDKKRELKATGELARVEIFVPSSHWAGSSWNKPKVGDVFLRLLLKNGNPGKRGLKLTNWEGGVGIPAGWFPKGVDPNAKAREKALAKEQAVAQGSD